MFQQVGEAIKRGEAKNTSDLIRLALKEFLEKGE